MPKSAKNLPLQEIKNTINRDKRDRTKSSKNHLSRIPRRCGNKNNDQTDLSPSGKKLVNDTKYNDNNKKNITYTSPSLEKSVSNSNSVPDGNEMVPKTPGCIAARIRSYSALRHSQRKKTGQVCSDEDQENSCCSPINTMSPSGEISHNQIVENNNNSELISDVESDEDILWKMSKRHIDKNEDMIPHAKVSEI